MASDKLRIFGSYLSPEVFSCFEIIIEITSGPNALAFSVSDDIFKNSPIINWGGASSAGKDVIRRSTLRLTNCRLNYSAHLFRSVTAMLLKVIEVLSSLFLGFESIYPHLSLIGFNGVVFKAQIDTKAL